MKRTLTILFGLLPLLVSGQSPMIAYTFDDPSEHAGVPLEETINIRILDVLRWNHLKAALFVCGKRVETEKGEAILKSWDKEGHWIANHSFSHFYYPSKKYAAGDLTGDIRKNDSIIRRYRNYHRLFRFPYLKEGDTREKRDAIRHFLNSAGYRNGYVSIDASDWYIDQCLIDTLKKNSGADVTPYHDFYLQHIYERACFYDSLATSLTGRKVKHVLLLHHNLVNAVFLDDLIAHFKKNGWQNISVDEAYEDPIYRELPDILPAGESIIWALAKASGKYESVLRYPAEDAEYEKPKLDAFLRK